MTLAQPWRNEHLHEPAAYHLVPAVAEDLLRHRIELDDALEVIGRDDAVEGGLERALIPQIALPLEFLRPFASGDVLHEMDDIGTALHVGCE